MLPSDLLIPVVAGVTALVVLVVLLAIILISSARLKHALERSRIETTAKLESLQNATRTQLDELSRNRQESSTGASALRGELARALELLTQALVKKLVEFSADQQQQLQTLSAESKAFRNSIEQSSAAFRDAVDTKLHRTALELAARLDQMRTEAAAGAQQLRSEVSDQLTRLTDSITSALVQIGGGQQQQIEALRVTVDEKLRQIDEQNSARLEAMRQTVEEKLQGTLEKRLGESFDLVSNRLEQVARGLGEMRELATGVGDLKRVLTNVKTRGTWAEVQLGMLLEQLMAPAQYAMNVDTKGTGERVEFAIKLPGRDGSGTVWLPIDAKFPQESYQRVVDAAERGDAAALEEAGSDLERAIKFAARQISEKYINPPTTTDFAVLYLPTEGLYAEVLRRQDLTDILIRDFRISIAGPTTLAAFLNSLQLGFRTLAIQQKSTEVWQVLGSVKTEFSRYTDLLAKVRKKLDEASSTVETAQVRTRAIERRLRNVQELPDGDVVPEAAALQEITEVTSEENGLATAANYFEQSA